MTTAEYQNLTPREANPGSASVLFSFARVRSGATTRFYPGVGAKLHFANRDVDTLTIPGVPSGFLAAGDTVTATYKGVTVFRGDVATLVEARSRGTDATQTVTCVGPWSKMQRLVYRQNWKTGASAYSYSSRLVLNEAEGGAAQTLNDALGEILDWADTPCGFSKGTVSVSTQILPFDECRDITAADAVKRELRLFPKAICRFDYSTATPTLHVVRAADGVTPVTRTAITDRQFVLNAHPITGVDLEIETTGNIEGVDYRQIGHQTAGNTLADNPDCLYATLQIRGCSSNTTRQSFKSVTEEIPANLNDATWWKARHPRLANVAASAITISDGAFTRTNAACTRISANTAGEIEAAGLKCEVSKFTCKATIETTDEKEEEIYLTLNYLITNATGTAADPKTYTWVTSASGESGESVPTGLATAILAERAGTIQSETFTIRLGDALPQLGEAVAESGQTLFLQSFDVDCAELTADLAYGIPEYLSPEDMAALLSNFRNKATCSSSFTRKTGKAKDGKNQVEMGAIPPLSSSEFAPGTKAKTTIKGSSSGGTTTGSIKLDSGEVDAGEEIAVHDLTLDGDDEPAAKVLATDDVEITEKTIAAGTGISVATSADGGTVTISATGEQGGGGSATTSGYSGSVALIHDIGYDTGTHSIYVKKTTLTISNGLITAVTADDSQIAEITAVEES